MPNDENTAVNALIARVHGGGQTSSSTGQAGHPMATSLPAKMPVAAPFEAPTSYPVVPRQVSSVPPPLDPNMPGGPGAGPGFRGPSATHPGYPPGYGPPGPPGMASGMNPGGMNPGMSGEMGAPWANATIPLNAPHPRGRNRNQEHLVGTIRVSRRSERQVMFGKLVLPMALLVVVGMLAGGYVAIRGERGVSRATRVAPAAASPEPAAPPAPAAVAPATPEPAAPAAAVQPAGAAPAAADPSAATVTLPPAPASLPAVPPAPVAPVPVPPAAGQPSAPALVDVRINSQPSGATVMLVDRGKTQLVGNTPISAALDPSREYDLVFSYPGKPTHLEHINVGTTPRVSVTLGEK
ncbi:MAG TPA: hypothetical protein VH165_33365 [Kofleriaceae bacterium]|jgi:hypothetical protein|nr:hypothetical protein [Kofleriaceae bacterium]